MEEMIDNYSFDTIEQKTAAKHFFAKVYAFMFGALLITGAIAYQYGTLEFALTYFYKVDPKGSASPTGLFYLVAFAPVGVAFLLQGMAQRLSFAAMFGLFAVYSVLLGFALSTIFIVYTDTSILSVFGITAGTFAIMAIMGFITPIDLTKFGSILMMAFWGIFLASIVNFFLESEMMDYVISIIGVLVFTGLTAYHMQQLKKMAYDAQIDTATKNKLALLGGFTLYVLFVNLFLSLLRLFGDRE